MTDCIFCRIIAGQQTHYKIFEDDTMVAFLDIFPITRGHTLVVPKKHYSSVTETPPEIMQSLVSRLQALAAVVVPALKAQGFNLGLNNGAAAGQIVPHVHWHLIPRYDHDGLQSWKNNKTSDVDLASVTSEITEALRSAKL